MKFNLTLNRKTPVLDIIHLYDMILVIEIKR